MEAVTLAIFLENKFLILRRDKKKRPDCKTIHSHITQHNATNLDENSLLNAIKFLVEENILKNCIDNVRYCIDNCNVIENVELQLN